VSRRRSASLRWTLVSAECIRLARLKPSTRVGGCDTPPDTRSPSPPALPWPLCLLATSATLGHALATASARLDRPRPPRVRPHDRKSQLTSRLGGTIQQIVQNNDSSLTYGARMLAAPLLTSQPARPGPRSPTPTVRSGQLHGADRRRQRRVGHLCIGPRHLGVLQRFDRLRRPVHPHLVLARIRAWTGLAGWSCASA